MSNELERFIKVNRDAFDEAEVPAALWSKIEQQVSPVKKTPVIKMGWVKLAAAAAVIAAVGLITLKTMNNDKPTGKEVVTTNTEVPATTNDTVDNGKEELVTTEQQPAENSSTEEQENLAQKDAEKNTNRTVDNNENSEIYHFTKLIQIKQKQLMSVKQYSPELYEHFVADYKKLDASYNELQEQLKINPNKEVLLEKMIANLQLQIGLLNEQLKVVRQLNKTKKEKADEIAKTM